MNNERIEAKFNKKIFRIKTLSKKTFQIDFEDETSLFLKEREKYVKSYEYLRNQGLENIVYPIDIIDLDGKSFYVFPFYEIPIYNKDKAIFDLKEQLMILHDKTLVEKKLKKNEFKKLYRLYKNLNYKFSLLETMIVEAEISKEKTDHDWILLSKYSIFIDTKREMYNLQKRIHDEIDKGLSVNFASLHGYPSLNHMIDKKLISLENSRQGIIISDIARLYVLNEDINIDWFTFIDEWISVYNDNFYKVYFKFLVYYLFMLNLNIDLTSKYLTSSNYILISYKLKKTAFYFESYQAKM